MGKHKQDRIVKVETEARAEGLSYGYMMARYREQGVTPFPEPKKKPAAGVTKDKGMRILRCGIHPVRQAAAEILLR